LLEQNKRLREGCDNGVAPKEDDSVMAQWRVLLHWRTK
jgi:hypothetical protein